MRYLDIAIDAVLATNDAPPEGQFYWTAETTLAVDDWWQTANDARRKSFLEAVGTGRLEIAALAMNQTPTLNLAEWKTTLHWLPDDLWDKVQPRAGVQNDVNGFPRAGAMALLDRGVDNLLMGINSTNGGPPVDRPTAFWWKMPDGRRMFVWLGDHYVSGFYYLHPASWRRGPVPRIDRHPLQTTTTWRTVPNRRRLRSRRSRPLARKARGSRSEGLQLSFPGRLRHQRVARRQRPPLPSHRRLRRRLEAARPETRTTPLYRRRCPWSG